MKIKVVIHRQRPNEESPGRLRAFIVQSRKDGNGNTIEVRGTDLLSRCVFKSVDSAYVECDEKIRAQFKLVEPDIEYEVDEVEGEQGKDA